MAATLAKRLTVRELAETYGKSEDAIRAWLHTLDERCPGLIKRAGKGQRGGGRIWVTLSALRRADPDFLEHQEISRDEIGELKAKCSALKEENISLRSRIRRLETAIEMLTKQTA